MIPSSAPALANVALPRAAYVHVPFCVHRCGYCDFTVIAGRDDLIPTYLDCLELELRRSLTEPLPVETLFLGGGTPSHLPADSLERLLQLLAEWLPVSSSGEFSIECNPDGLTTEKMEIFRSGGINRISLGVQSTRTADLQLLERAHTPEMVARVIEQLREVGFSNVSVDLIFGIPGQTLDDWEQTLVQAIDWEPEHVSTYGLTFEKGTSFWGRREKGDLIPAADDLERDMYATGMQRLTAAEFEQYELSNFARPGHRCRHNLVYWNGDSYAGFGPGAAGFLNGERIRNHRSVSAWIQRLKKGETAVQEREPFDPDLRAREAVMLGLRKIEGINREEFERRHDRDLRSLAAGEYDALLKRGWLEETPTHVRLTLEGRFVADTVVAEFF